MYVSVESEEFSIADHEVIDHKTKMIVLPSLKLFPVPVISKGFGQKTPLGESEGREVNTIEDINNSSDRNTKSVEPKTSYKSPLTHAHHANSPN